MQGFLFDLPAIHMFPPCKKRHAGLQSLCAFFNQSKQLKTAQGCAVNLRVCPLSYLKQVSTHGWVKTTKHWVILTK